MNAFRPLLVFLAGLLLSVPLVAGAQNAPPPEQLPQDQLDGLLAPIALYPDELLTQVLMASTYPLEVVEAARFVKANPTLKGQALDDALRQQTWDPSVLSLAQFPQVLDMMNDKLDWTQRLGDAFLADEDGVMRTVQSLRLRAQQAGNLQSTPQQVVEFQGSNIVIEPAQPQVVYVPVYNPLVIYGPWWAPAYPPWYWYPPPIWGYPPAPPNWGVAAGFFWGTAWAINRSYWGWARPNWNSHNVNININVNNNYWASRPQYRDRYPNGTGNWNHIPEHRKGVAYRDPVTNNKYRPTNPSAVQTRENYRGNNPRPSPTDNAGSQFNRPVTGGNAPATRPSGPGTGQVGTRPTNPAINQPAPRPTAPATGPTSPAVTQPAPRPTDRSIPRTPPPNQATARPAPTFQTQPRSQVQMESNRGQASRQQMNQPQRSAAPAPSGGAARGGGGGGAGQGRSR
jgi:hypothetical protein